jgi:tRNA dimethylallyltransferase
MKGKILIISGPTASGKSGLALEISSNIKSVIINADSMQLYKELPILSSQPSTEDFSKNEHVLYSILSYSDESTLNDWLCLAKSQIDKALKENKLPILVGGTGMYISKLIEGINEIPQIDKKFRSYGSKLFRQLGIDGLKDELLKLGDDPIDVKDLDKQRLIRRLEIIKQTGKPISYWQSLPVKKFYDQEQFVHVNLNPNRQELYAKCDKRFEMMLARGAIDEVKRFLDLDPDKDLSICKTIGVLEIEEFLNNSIEMDQVIEISSQKTRNYAKRQLTWFRNLFKNKVEVTNVSRETVQKIIKLL